MLAQLVQDLVHLERGEDRLDEDRRPDRAARDPERDLAVDEDLVPQPRLVVALELGQVEIRAAPPPQRSRPRSGTGTARSRTGWPTPARRRRAAPTRRGASRAAGRRASRSDRRAGRPCPPGDSNVERPADRVGQRGLAADDVRPGRRQGVLEIGHEHARPGVERVDHHLRLGRPGDLDPPVVEVGRRRGDRPGRLADLAGRDREVGPDAGIELDLALLAGGGAGPAGPDRSGAGGRPRRRARRRSGSVRHRGRRRAAARRPVAGRPGQPCQPAPRRTVASIRPCGSVVGV